MEGRVLNGMNFSPGPRGGMTLAWLLAGSSTRIGLYFWSGVCMWIGRLVGSAEICPTAATVKR